MKEETLRINLNLATGLQFFNCDYDIKGSLASVSLDDCNTLIIQEQGSAFPDEFLKVCPNDISIEVALFEKGGIYAMEFKLYTDTLPQNQIWHIKKFSNELLNFQVTNDSSALTIALPNSNIKAIFSYSEDVLTIS